MFHNVIAILIMFKVANIPYSKPKTHIKVGAVLINL